MSDFDLQHVGEVIADPERYSNFTAWLLRLIAKADPINREHLRRAFPEEVEAFEKWEAKPPEPELERKAIIEFIREDFGRYRHIRFVEDPAVVELIEKGARLLGIKIEWVEIDIRHF